MTPRRPAPARPGARPGARTRAGRPRSAPEWAGDARRLDNTSGASRTRGTHEDRDHAHNIAAPDTPARDNSSNRGNRDQQRRDGGRSAGHTPPRPSEHTMVRVGGDYGLAISARLLLLSGTIVVSFIMLFPTVRGYLAQQAQYDAVVSHLADARATATVLESDLARWDDDDYVRSQARERLSYVMPGETTYVVVGADRFAETDAADAAASGTAAFPPWYEVVRDSAQVAGDTGERALEHSQQGWSTAIPTVPTPDTTPPPPDGGDEAAATDQIETETEDTP